MQIKSREITTTHFTLDLDDNELHALYYWLCKSTCAGDLIGAPQRLLVAEIRKTIADNIDAW
ncbi:hypothetical protein SEA_WEASELS2_14 [Rhodococcus phage Weasels2]|uniref:Uncharacterized protein n=1 Tax=Rhodococcus phage Weasels2 TaxID=1897437 RepID=A0A1I9S9Z8_9CAUD|nr:hypothetical protein FDH04_gp014 [Rhodococcus phage Weasels2]AOZ63604.1 hypothetical protein SEA_WEASELS2_14 [Rhodococcus phage Weasels2]